MHPKKPITERKGEIIEEKSWENMSALKKHLFYLNYFCWVYYSRCLTNPSSQSSTVLSPLSLWGPTTTFSSAPHLPTHQQKGPFSCCQRPHCTGSKGYETCRPSAPLACAGIEICLSRDGICVCMCTSLCITLYSCLCLFCAPSGSGDPCSHGETSLKNNVCLTT